MFSFLIGSERSDLYFMKIVIAMILYAVWKHNVAIIKVKTHLSGMLNCYFWIKILFLSLFFIINTTVRYCNIFHRSCCRFFLCDHVRPSPHSNSRQNATYLKVAGALGYNLLLDSLGCTNIKENVDSPFFAGIFFKV